MELNTLRDGVHIYYSNEASSLNRCQPEGVLVSFRIKIAPKKARKNLTKLQTRGKNIQTQCAFECNLTYQI